MMLNGCDAISEEETRRFQTRESIGTCPVCGSLVYESKTNFYCSNHDCHFALWKDNRYLQSMEKTMDKKMAAELLKNGSVHVKDLYSRKKNMYFNQFAVYRVDQQTAGKALWHLPYQEARQQNVSITVENYRLISIHEMQENEKVADIWKRTKNQCEVSDVLVLNKNGEISCYYVDENYPQYLAGFIRINTSGALITMETENYQIDGKKGNWIATDTVIIDGKQFYLMEHQVYRDQAQGVILDAYGKMVVEECKKFDEKTKQKIHDYIQQQVPLNPVEQLKQDGKIRLEHYQKFYQNGTYERSRESGTEANYDMVDGLVNNQKKNLEKISDARNNKQTSRNQQNNKPKKRRSVIKRLHQKQIAIARRSGKPIPKYLDQEMERKRG